MKKTFEILFNLAYFGCYSLLIYLFFSLATQGFGVPHMPTIRNAIISIIVVPTIFSYLGMYFYVFPKYLHKRLWIKALFFGFLNIAVATLLGAICISVLIEMDTMLGPSTLDIGIKISFFVVVAVVNSVMAWVIHGFITWYSESNLKQELEMKNQQMEMALLKSKMDPHFLFNSLNNIDALIQKDAELGSRYVNKLSNLIRFMLYETQHSNILLSKEITYLKEYIDLQCIRTSNKEFVELVIEGDPLALDVAPVILIPFVENAFKHVSNKKEKHAIRIKIQVSESSLNFSCTNRFTLKEAGIVSSNSMGNELIEKRLNLLYPSSHTLRIQNSNDLYSVQLKVNFE